MVVARSTRLQAHLTSYMASLCGFHEYMIHEGEPKHDDILDDKQVLMGIESTVAEVFGLPR